LFGGEKIRLQPSALNAVNPNDLADSEAALVGRQGRQRRLGWGWVGVVHAVNLSRNGATVQIYLNYFRQAMPTKKTSLAKDWSF
jgi:hypothetical protein